MKKHDFLIPRYKVIADYPRMEYNGRYKVGDILLDNGKTAVINQNDEPVYACEFDKFPHLFKKLEWWEERKKSEMPKYVQVQKTGEVLFIEKWSMENYDKGSVNTTAIHKGYCYFVQGITPITEEEYNSLINK